MVKTDIKITRYEFDGVWIDIVDLGDSFEAWLQEKDYAYARFLFGLPKEQKMGYIDYEQFVEIVHSNLAQGAYYEIDTGTETRVC